MPDDYEVGFGKPPKKNRFRKGVSGNPQGRPRGTLNPENAFLRALQEKLFITEYGKRMKASKLEVLCKKLVNKAVTGDPKATNEVIKLLRFYGLDRSQPDKNESVPTPYDTERFLAIIREAYGLPPTESRIL